MKRSVLSALMMALLPFANVSVAAQTPPAQTVAVTTAPPLFLTILVLLASGACVYFCWQVYSLVRGGQLSRSWLFFAAGFFVLGLSQFTQLLDGFGVFSVPRFLVPMALIMMTGLFSFGLLETKKVLS